MISSSRLRRRNVDVQRSQAALELALTLLAAIAGLAVVRVLILVAGIPVQSWAGSPLATVTDLLVLPLEAIPGGARPVVGAATLADVTTAVLLVIVPIFALSLAPRA